MDRAYWGRAAASLARNLRRRTFVKEWLSAGLREDEAQRAHQKYVFEMYPTMAECVVQMGDVVYRPFNLDPTERFCLAALAQITKPDKIFEFGTYDGATTLLLARSSPDAQIFTLDLPLDILDNSQSIIKDQLVAAGGTGSKFADQPEAARIVQLLGDSRHFDFEPYHGQMDLILIDGAHEYEVVRSDSENALKMLAPDGIIVWDDYHPYWPGVVQAVDEIATSRSLPVVKLEPGDFVVYDRSQGR
jgi:predicted O-methyltransferase YrrM